MKVLLVNTFDTKSGSAIAARRLNRGLQRINVNAQLLVQVKRSADPTILGSVTKAEAFRGKLSRGFHNLPLKLDLKLRRQSLPAEFSIPWLSDSLLPRLASINPDVINLHWTNYNYLSIEELAQLNKPLVWTLHDMWAFTGGCHYSETCDRYTKHCGTCPQLHSKREQDWSSWIWQRKDNAWKELNLTVVTPSAWLARCAADSSLFNHQRIEVIPNGLDTAIYQPVDRQIAREKLLLPLDKQLILFGAINATSSHRKGFHLLQPALQALSRSGWRGRLELVVFGSAPSANQLDLGLRTHYLGELNDDALLALAYAAADVFVAPSVQENLPNTLVEAIACGTPGVAFNIGGIPEIIEHQQNGYLAQPYQTDDLAAGIVWVLEHPDRYLKLCDRARQKAVQEFTVDLQAHRYETTYRETLAGFKL